MNRTRPEDAEQQHTQRNLTFGSRLRLERLKHGWTLKEVAEKLNMPHFSTYSNWEYDRRVPDKNAIEILCELYGVSSDYLIFGSNREERKKSPSDRVALTIEGFFDLLETQTNEQILNEYSHIIGGAVDPEIVGDLLKYARYLRTRNRNKSG